MPTLLTAAYPQAAPAPRPPSAQQVYSLGDEEEEEPGELAADGAARGAWVAELGLLALHAAVLLPKQVSTFGGGDVMRFVMLVLALGAC